MLARVLLDSKVAWVNFDSTLTEISRVRVEPTVKIKNMSRIRVESRWSSFESELSQLDSPWVKVESLIVLKRKRIENCIEKKRIEKRKNQSTAIFNRLIVNNFWPTQVKCTMSRWSNLTCPFHISGTAWRTVLNRVGIFAGKKYFLPLAGFNRFKPAKSGRKWQKWKWPTASLYMLLKVSKHFHTQYVMSSGITDCWYATKCCLSLNISAFSLSSLPVQKDDNRPLTGNRTIYDRIVALNVLACLSTCQA